MIPVPFETFVDYYGNYPSQSSFSQLVSPLPTNSWIENAVVDNIAKGNCFFNTIPWTWVALYEEAKVSLDHSSYVDSYNSLTQGNLSQIYGRGNAFVVYESSHAPYTLKDVSDMCAYFSSSKMSVYPSRGSVLQSFVFDAADVVIDFVQGSIADLVLSGNKTTLQYQRIKNSIGTSSEYKTTSGNGELVITCWFYKDFVRYDETGFDVKLSVVASRGVDSASTTNGLTTLSGTSMTFSLLGNDYVISSNNTSGSFASTGPGVTGIVTNTSTIITIVPPSGNLETFVINIQYDSVGLVTTTYSRPLTQKVVIYGPPLTLQGNSLVSQGYTGTMQVANADDWGTDLDMFAGQYFVSGTVGEYQYSDQGIVFETSYSPVDSQQPSLLPNHWNSYSMLGGVNIGTPVLFNMIYGDVYPYVLSSSVVCSLPLSIPTLSAVTTLPVSITSLLKEEIKTATEFLPEFDAYAFGQSSFALVRLLLYAKTLVYDNDPLIVAAKTKLLAFLTRWLSNTNDVSSPAKCEQTVGYPHNKTMHRLQYETKWGGIVLPADYLNINESCYYNQSDYGSSYYNDHHFHWGYFFYTINALMFLYSDTGLENYRDAITYLLMDVVSPTKNTFTKTRYKDWYGGHSLATGFEPTPIIDAQGNYVGPLLSPPSGPIQRQQESCSEAVHCYYGAYLLADRLGLADIAATSAVCLSTEISAIQNYYYMSAPGSNTGVLGAAVGILFTDSKQITLDWGPQPDSHNGRMCGTYGIQALPFTEISYLQIQTGWVNRCATYPVDSFVMNQQLCMDLVRETYTPKLYTNEVVLVPYDTKGGLQWGAVASKILCFGSSQILSNQNAQEIYQQLRNDRIYDLIVQAYLPPLLLQFDSITHTYYFMYRAGKVTSFDTDKFSPSQEVVLSLPFPTPTYKELLATSSLKAQCLIEVPLLRAGTQLSLDNTQVEEIYYQITDTYEYTHRKTAPKKECCKGTQCKVNGATKCEIVVTNLSTLLNPISTINAEGLTYQDKSNNLPGSRSELLLSYSILKLGLARLLYGVFDVKYLTGRYNDTFFSDLAKSRFCAFVSVLRKQFPDYNRFFVY